MALYELNETYINWTKIRTRDKVMVDADTITITITDSCGTEVVSAQAMTNEATGEYSYAYDIPKDAQYGIYDVIVTATSVDKSVSKFRDSFIILPWDITTFIRRISGIKEEKTIGDDDIAMIAWESYKEVLDDVYEKVDMERPLTDPSTGVGFDGTNTSFQTKQYPIADHNGDGSVTGKGELTCGEDAYFYWKDSNYSLQEGKIKIDKERNGEVTLTQSDDSPVPNTATACYVTYWIEYETFDSTLLKKAVAYHAAHEIMLQFSNLDKATLADLETNKPIILATPNRMLKKYKTIRDRIRKPVCDGVVY